MAKNYTRRTLLSAVGLGAATSVAGCSQLQRAETADGETLRVGSQWGISSLDPMEGSTQLQRIGIFESLVSLDWEGSIQPQLATDWETADDGRTLRFELREDVTFHDGSPFDADAMAFSLRRAFDTSLSTLPVESVSTLDSHTLSVSMTEQFAPILAHLTRRKAVAISPDAVDGETINEPVGTGPFAFDSWRSETGDITVVRNDDYYGDPAHVPRLVYENVSDGQTRELKLRNDELDIATQINPTAVSRLTDDEGTVTQTYETPRLRYFSFNLTEPPVDDQRVRQAFLYGINTEQIVEAVLDGYGEAATGLLPPSIEDWHNGELEPYAHDPEEAARLLSAAGWEPVDDGPRQRDGDSLEITLWTYNSRPALAIIAEAIQQQLTEIGFETSVRVTDWGGMDDAKESGEASMTLESTSSYGWPPDPDRLRYFVHTEEGKAVGYDNSDVDELFAEGRSTIDPDERKAIYDEIQAIAHEELPVGILTYQQNVIGLRRNVSGHEPHPTEYRYNFEDVTL